MPRTLLGRPPVAASGNAAAPFLAHRAQSPGLVAATPWWTDTTSTLREGPGGTRHALPEPTF